MGDLIGVLLSAGALAGATLLAERHVGVRSIRGLWLPSVAAATLGIAFLIGGSPGGVICGPEPGVTPASPSAAAELTDVLGGYGGILGLALWVGFIALAGAQRNSGLAIKLHAGAAAGVGGCLAWIVIDEIAGSGC